MLVLLEVSTIVLLALGGLADVKQKHFYWMKYGLGLAIFAVLLWIANVVFSLLSLPPTAALPSLSSD